jgi:hypothetical protein
MPSNFPHSNTAGDKFVEADKRWSATAHDRTNTHPFLHHAAGLDCTSPH